MPYKVNPYKAKIYKGKTLADFPKAAAKLHPRIKDQIDPRAIRAGSLQKLPWKCYEGKWPTGAYADDHEWKASVAPMVKLASAGTSGCPCCRGRKAVPSNCFPTTHPEIAVCWHPDNATCKECDFIWLSGQEPTCCPACHSQKAMRFAPEQVTAGSHKSPWWICDKGKWPDGTPADDHIFRSPVKLMIRSAVSPTGGCPCCHRLKAVPSNCLPTTHPEIAGQWHPDNTICKRCGHVWLLQTDDGQCLKCASCDFRNFRPEEVTAGSHKKVFWICDQGKWPNGSLANDHVWKASVKDRTRGSGCSCCRSLTVVPSNCLAATHPPVAKEWHQTKNGATTPNNEIAGSRISRWWKCGDCGFVWAATPLSRTFRHGSGCPQCNAYKGEKVIRKYLIGRRIPHKPQWKAPNHGLGQQRFDFGDDRDDPNWLIEYHGEQHYLPRNFGSKKDTARYRLFIRVLKCDRRKEKWCELRNKKPLIIPFWDYKRTEEILDDFFAGKTPRISEPPEIVKKHEPMRRKISDRIESELDHALVR